jgi:hypothetical protein
LRSVDQCQQGLPPVLDATSRLCLLMNVSESLLYMMSADGSVGEEEIGRLNAVALAVPSVLPPESAVSASTAALMPLAGVQSSGRYPRRPDT